MLKTLILLVSVLTVTSNAAIVSTGKPVVDVYHGGYISAIYHGGYVFQRYVPSLDKLAYAIEPVATGGGIGGASATLDTQFGGDFTLATWVKLNESPPALNLLMESHVPSYGNIWFLVAYFGGSWQGMLYDGSVNPVCAIPDETPWDGWHLVVFRRRTADTTITLWVNGETATETDYTFPPPYGPYSVGGSVNSTWGFGGKLDTQIGWSRALTDAEIADLYATTSNVDWATATFQSSSTLMTESCMFLHRFNEEGGDSLTDLMGNSPLTWGLAPSFRQAGTVGDYSP